MAIRSGEGRKAWVLHTDGWSEVIPSTGAAITTLKAKVTL